MDSFKLIYNQMACDYESLLGNENLSDLVLAAGGKELKVHKLILSARSPVFAAMFAHSSTKEAQENRVEMIDVDVEVLQLMVRYIYTGKVDTLGLNAAQLLVAADKYQLNCLKSICMQQLLSQISTESVCDLLIFADIYQATELNTEYLAQKCVDYITDHGTRVITSEGWNNIVVRTDLMATIYQQMQLKFTKFIYNVLEFNDFKLLNISDEDGVMKIEYKMDDGTIDWGRQPDLAFQSYLLKHSNVINFKEEMTDVILAAGSTELKVHKKVLSAGSPVFAEMFSHNTAQRNRGVIRHVDVEMLKLLLKYIYTGKIEGLDHYAVRLFVAADKFQVNCLKSICKQQLLSRAITIESVADLLILADMCGNAKLYSKCLDYIANNSTQVIASEGWKMIVLKTGLLANICNGLKWDFTEQLLLSPITIESVSNLFILADVHQLAELTAKCVDYITDNVTEVMQEQDWKKIVASAHLVAKLFERMSWKYSKLNLRYAPIIYYHDHN